MTGEPVAAAPPAPVDTVERREGVRERVADAGLDALLVTGRSNVRYLSGFTGSAGLLVVSAQPPDYFFTDFRYQAQVTGELDPAVEVRIASESLLKQARLLLTERGAGRVAFEREQMSYRSWVEWCESEGPALVPVQEWVEEARAVKSAAEIEAIRRACRVADATFEVMLGVIREGVTERELAARLGLELAREGADGPSFEPIVAFGERAALPHARPSARELRRGEVVLFDFGALVDGYVSDMTRTVAFGDPGPELRDIYSGVLAAQEAALRGIRAGMSGPEADALARDPLEAAGYGELFGHSLGHGIGLEVHEAPRLSKKSEDRLVPGMTVTVEPGVYLEGVGGVRIEDDVVIRESGLEILTASPKDRLIVL
ncbi:MAG TPA: Xaa-Pro peptidase family protein [Gemmatimonadota bacterium]|nr:Xaa-Pro peptidase family protein [Gemmatimonadota bacterium]